MTLCRAKIAPPSSRELHIGPFGQGGTGRPPSVQGTKPSIGGGSKADTDTPAADPVFVIHSSPQRPRRDLDGLSQANLSYPGPPEMVGMTVAGQRISSA